MMTTHKYADQALVGDYMRATFGLCLTLPPVILIRPDAWITMMLLIVAGICAFFLVRTIERHRTVVSSDDTGIVLRSFSTAAIAWPNVTRITLTYYTVKRDRDNGWMQLTIHSGNAKISVDSRISDFIKIVERAARAAKQNELMLNGVTLANLNALRITGD